MHRIGCEYFMPAVIIAFPFIKVYSWKKYTALRLWAVYFFVSLGGALGRAACAETGCFGDSQNELRCKNNGIRGETARHARKRGVFGNRKTNYVVKTTELERKPRAVRGNWVFSGIAKRITL